jgi:hypothetical protein
MCPVVIHGQITYLAVNIHKKLVSNKYITHIQPSTGFGSMGPSSGRFFPHINPNAVTENLYNINALKLCIV